MEQQSSPIERQRPPARGSVTVVTILREPLELTLRFVAWYLDLGAARIDLYFDDPEDPAIERLEGHDKIRITRCTPDFWRSLDIGPDAPFTRRQNRVLRQAYDTATTAWVLNVDADELIWLEGRNLRRFAARQADAVRAVRVMPAEVVRTPSDEQATWFRLPMRRRHVRQVYGDDHKLFISRAGLVGHSDGKSMIRTGLALSGLRQHWATDADGAPINDKKVGKRQKALLLHFVDNGFDQWREKADWRAESAGFSRHIRERLAQKEATVEREDFLRDLYRALHHFDPHRLEQLQAVGRAVRLELDFDAPRDRLFAEGLVQGEGDRQALANRGR